MQQNDGISLQKGPSGPFPPPRNNLPGTTIGSFQSLQIVPQTLVSRMSRQPLLENPASRLLLPGPGQQDPQVQESPGIPGMGRQETPSPVQGLFGASQAGQDHGAVVPGLGIVGMSFHQGLDLHQGLVWTVLLQEKPHEQVTQTAAVLDPQKTAGQNLLGLLVAAQGATGRGPAQPGGRIGPQPGSSGLVQ